MTIKFALKRASAWKRASLNIALAISIAIGPLFMPLTAQAISFSNDYPDMNAVNCSGQFGEFSWCKNGTPLSPRGYNYRNCTDGAAYWVSKYTGRNVRGWSHAFNWDEKARAAGYTVKTSNSNNIEPADIAQRNGGYGHVGFVTSVNKDADGKITSITIAELNYDSNGNYRGPGMPGSIQNPSTWEYFIDVNGIGYGLGNEELGAIDTDRDGVPDSDDLAITTPGPKNNRGIPNYSSKLSGDFNGDGKDDIMAFYDYGGDSSSLKVFYGNDSGKFTDFATVWNSGVGNWRWANTKTVTGDFNGDGKTDIVAIYNHGSDQTKFWLFPGTSTGPVTPAPVWDSGVGNWRWENIKPIAGDFNGDGKWDIGAFYDYGGDTTALFRFYGKGNGTFANGVSVWNSGPGNWRWNNIKPIVGDFNGDGKWETGAFYDYGSDLTKLWIFPGSQGSTSPRQAWSSGSGNWRWKNMLEITGDFNGDAKTDIGALYNYGNGTTALFRFYGKGDRTFTPPTSVWNSGSNNWVWGNLKPTTGDFNGDNKTDVGTFYDYGGGSTSIWTLPGSQGSTSPNRAWNSGAGNWEWARGLPL